MPAVGAAQASPLQQVMQLCVQPWHSPIAALQLIVALQGVHVPPAPQPRSVMAVQDAGPPASGFNGWQQPVVQPEVASQVQTPAWQICPVGHAGPAPQVQPTAPEPQPSA